MRVAIDVTPMVGGPRGVRTGIGQTVVTLMSALPATADDITFLPYALSRRARGAPGLPVGTNVVPIPARVLLPMWARTDHPRIDRWLGSPDVVHATNYLTPATKAKKVVWVHDVAFLRDPRLGSADAQAYGATMRRAARQGALFVTGAQAIAEEVRAALAPDLRNGSAVTVVPLALPALPTATPTRVGPAVPYILALGTCEPRKNLPRLVEAFGRIAAALSDYALVLAGPDGSDRSNVLAAIDALSPEIAARVFMLGPVTDADRVALLRDASLLAYPSLAEGFGLPMLEAMSCQTAVVAANVGSIPEVAGNAALLVDPLDVDAIADAIQRILEDSTLRSTLIDRGLVRSATFTPDAMASGLIACYRQVLA